MVFGPAAVQRYGPDMTLREALDGRGDIYRTLLWEATAVLLNAYYNTPGVLSCSRLVGGGDVSTELACVVFLGEDRGAKQLRG
uniref:Uncharacterized protein n=1 Tax=Oryza nivara TaxID=4536 RepID=A0A0E0HD04_ORYNI